MASAQAIEEGEVTEEKVSRADMGISVMLLGSVGFMMSLFYLVNQKDPDMRKYSWQVISSTISIFSAVLLFQAINGIVEDLILDEASEDVELFVSIGHMLVWFIMLQVTLAWISGAVGNPPESLEEVELNMKCWGILLGHITGFASINCFATLQQQVPRQFLCTLLVAPSAWLAVYILGLCTDSVREWVALSDDGEKDEFEEKWDEETEETEDDVIGLAVSWLVVQSLRFRIGGVLPNKEGEEPEDLSTSHGGREVLMLLGCGVLFAVLNVLRTIYVKGSFKRLTPQMRNVVAMCFAWCLFFSSDWLLSAHLFKEEQGMMKTVVLALFVTTVAFSMIFLLDKLADLESTADHVEQAIRAVVQALGILIGFSWERSFDTGVMEISIVTQQYVPRSVAKLLLAIVLAAVVIPAWRMHILPTLHEIEEAEAEAKKDFAEIEKEIEEEIEEAQEAGSSGRHSQQEGTPGSHRFSRLSFGRASTANALEEPLLLEEMREDAEERMDRVRKEAANLVGMSEIALRSKCIELQVRVEELEHLAAQTLTLQRRNAELEESMASISQELSDLQRLADELAQ